MFGRVRPVSLQPNVLPFVAETLTETLGAVNTTQMMQLIPFSPNWIPFPNGGSPSGGRPASSEEGRGIEEAHSFPVIVAEDDPVSRELVRTLLEKWGYRVIVTSDGREAMEAIRAQTTPALAVLDWMMPGMDGLQICQRVREANKVLYIILLTARGGKERLIEGLQAGADDYLMKPFDKDELRARLQVGARIIALHMTLAARIQQLEAASSEIRSLKLQLPL